MPDRVETSTEAIGDVASALWPAAGEAETPPESSSVPRSHFSSLRVTDEARAPAALAEKTEAEQKGEEAGDSKSGWRTIFTALRYPQYRTLMSGMLPSLFGMQMGMVALSYTVYTLSGSATALGAMGLAWGLPMLFLSLFGGVAADRFPRRSVLIATQATICVSATICAALVLAGVVQVWHLFAVGLLQGTAFAFNMPARTALIGEAVGKEDMPNAIALNNAAMNLSRVAGPGIAGMLIAWPLIGTGGVMVIWAAGYIFAILTLARLTIGRTASLAKDHDPASGRSRPSSMQQLVEGLTYIRRSPALLTLLSLAFVPIFLGMPYQMLLPVFALGLLNVGSEGMGLMQAANGVGALVGSLAVAALGGFEHKSTLQLALGIVFGLSLVAFALAGSFVLALLILPVVGALASAYTALNSALVMSNTARELYGRVMSVYMMTFALMPLGSLPAASLADTIGPSLTVATAGGLLALVVAATAILVPSYRKIR